MVTKETKSNANGETKGKADDVDRLVNKSLNSMVTEKKETKGKADNVDRLVSQRLKMRRMMLALTQEDLAKALNVSIQQVQKYEKALNRVSSGKLYALAKFLKVTVNYFFEQNDDTGNTMGMIFAESSETYSAENSRENNRDTISEKEIVTLIKAFSDIKSFNSRKKIIDLIKTMV